MHSRAFVRGRSLPSIPATVYDDAARVGTLLDSLGWAYQLTLEDALDAARLMYRKQIPPLRRVPFLSIVVDEPTYREGKKHLLRYGDSEIRYGDGYVYGEPAATVSGAVELPAGLVDVDLCCDLPVDPSAILLKNEHFKIRNGYLVFEKDLFEILPEQDGKITLWLRAGYRDQRFLQDRIGLLTQTRGDSTPAYRDFCNKILDCVAEGTNDHRLTQLVCLLYDVPCTETKEIVEAIGTDIRGRWLATDRAVYRAPLSASFRDPVGTTLDPGTILTDAIRPIRGRSFPENVPLVLERRFLGTSYASGLVFPNGDFPLTRHLRTRRWTFPVTGREEDVNRFWDTFYARTADPELLTSATVGGKINPARFLYEQLLYPRARFYAVSLEKSGDNRLPTINTQVFRGLLPPGVLFSLLTSSVTPSNLDLPSWSGSAEPIGVSAARVALAIPLHFTKITIKPC